MNINKNTWHYKLFEFAMKYTKDTETNCSYLRGVLFGVLKVLAISTIAAIIIFGMINWIILIATGVLLVGALIHEVIGAIVILLGILAWVGLIAFSLYTLFEYLKTKDSLVSSINKASSGISNTYKAINLPTIKKGSFLDLLIVSIKNQHDKICTIVTFTQD